MNFYTGLDLSDNQKDKIYNICWSANQIKDYASVFATPKTLKLKMSKFIDDIMNFMINFGYVQPR